MTDFFFPAFPHNDKLCPVETLRAYEKRTEAFREHTSKLFIATIKPHQPVSSSTIARWLKTMLSKAGINTDTFKAHSVRSASVTAAANAGITTNDILKAANWSTASVFQKFYYKPTGDTVFGSTVLSTAANH